MSGKKLSLAAAVIFVAVILSLLTWAMHKPPNVNLVVSPTTAVAVMDEKDTVSPGEFHTSPGEHSITARFNGFSDQKVSFEAPRNGVKTVYIILQPSSQAGYTWLQNHPGEQKLREKYGGQQFSKNAATFTQNNQIVQYLPFVGNGDAPFRIDYTFPKNPSSPVTLIVTYYTGAGKGYALTWLKNKGYPVGTNKSHIKFVNKT